MRIKLRKNMEVGEIYQCFGEYTEIALYLQVYGILKANHEPIPTPEHLKQRIQQAINEKKVKNIFIDGFDGFKYTPKFLLLFRRANICGINIILFARTQRKFWFARKYRYTYS